MALGCVSLVATSAPVHAPPSSPCWVSFSYFQSHGVASCASSVLRPSEQQVALRKLLVRTEDEAQAVPEDRRIPLPFVVISAGEETAIHVEIDTPDR